MSSLIKYRASSAAFSWGRLTFTSSKAGCVRYIYLVNYGINTGDIPQKYKDLGEKNELRYQKSLEDSETSYRREVVVKQPFEDEPRVCFSGRYDFGVDYPGVGSWIIELKGSQSKNTLYQIINKNDYKPEHLAQLTAYMWQTGSVGGTLEYAYYKKLDETQPVTKPYQVEIGSGGDVYVDTEKSPYSLRDLRQHRDNVAQAVEQDRIWERPFGGTTPYKGACYYCDFRPVCDKFDEGEIKSPQEFREHADKLVSSQDGN